MTEWISVKDRLPKYNEEVLLTRVVSPSFFTHVGWRVYTNAEGEHYNYGGPDESYQPTHWMPLPDRP